jgi:hypothetical protein
MFRETSAIVDDELLSRGKINTSKQVSALARLETSDRFLENFDVSDTRPVMQADDPEIKPSVPEL